MLFKVAAPVVVNAPVIFVVPTTSKVLLSWVASDTVNVLFKVAAPVVVNAPVIFVAPSTSKVLFKVAAPTVVSVAPNDTSLDTFNTLFKETAFDTVNVSFNVALPVIVIFPLTAAVPLTSKFAFALTLDLLIPTLLLVNKTKSLAKSVTPPPSVEIDILPLSTDNELVWVCPKTVVSKTIVFVSICSVLP